MRKLFRNDSANVRPPAVAGRFYPDNPAELRRMIENFLREPDAPTGSSPKAVIAPHAGYIYSGPIAASAYAQLAPSRDSIKRVVLLGPSHFASFDGSGGVRRDGVRDPARHRARGHRRHSLTSARDCRR